MAELSSRSGNLVSSNCVTHRQAKCQPAIGREPLADEIRSMPAHWTYDAFSSQADLAQGDVIEPTEALRTVLQTVHPHFLDAKYVSFLILSQSCDLVRRSGYRGQPINLCVVRELDAIASRLLELTCGSGIPGIFREDRRDSARLFLERVVNQNEQAVGLFYLHPDADAGVSTPSVAMLRISIALRADHYDVLVNARRGRVRPEFQAKLGWLIGNLYSRVGTEDWSSPPSRQNEQDTILKQTLQNLPGIEWGSSGALKKAKQAKFIAEGLSPDEVRKALSSFEPPTLDMEVQDAIARIIAAADLALPNHLQKQILNRLRNDSQMSSYFSRMKKR